MDDFENDEATIRPLFCGNLLVGDIRLKTGTPEHYETVSRKLQEFMAVSEVVAPVAGFGQVKVNRFIDIHGV